MATPATTFHTEDLLQAARDRTGLTDFGDMWFAEPMAQYVAAANAEAQLTPEGFAGQTEVIVKGLASRLRMVEDIRRHPEILDEKVEVAGIILGLPRTGSTVFHRLLASGAGDDRDQAGTRRRILRRFPMKQIGNPAGPPRLCPGDDRRLAPAVRRNWPRSTRSTPTRPTRRS